MARYIIRITIIVCVTTLSAAEEKPIVISGMCELVNERTYFVERLEKLVAFISHVNEDMHVMLTTQEAETFTHPTIKMVITQIEEQQSLASFFAVWKNLTAYKDIHDHKLVKEFTKLALLLIAKNIRGEERLSIPHIPCSTTSPCFTEAVTLRHYYVKRLQKPLSVLSQIKCKRDTLFELPASPEEGCDCVFSSNISFQNPDIISCIKQLESTSSLKPLMTLSQEFSKYKYVQDDSFTREFLLLVFCVYKNIITHNSGLDDIPHRITPDQIQLLYQKIESLPIEQILSAIDVLSEELPHMLNHYNFYNKTSWKKWIKKYWWVPPLIAAKVGLLILLRARRARNPLGYLNFNHGIAGEGWGKR